MKIVSLFSGAGGLDLGFEKAGYNIIYANEYDKDIWETYKNNFDSNKLDTRSITDIHENEIPDCDGIIGGPPCQSWSAAGALRGIADKRGQLFYDFIRIIKAKKPKFFLAENVAGMTAERHKSALKNIHKLFIECGYKLHFKMLNASSFSVAQDRKRVFFIGIRNDIKTEFKFPEEHQNKLALKDVIYDLRDHALPCLNKGLKNIKSDKFISNHEYLVGTFSTIYMSRNRVRAWDEQSFTIQAGGRHAPLHPQAPKMIKIGVDKMMFAPEFLDRYRRLTVRECARLQGFPDSHYFYYKNVLTGYKMIGNAVPVNLAHSVAVSISNCLSSCELNYPSSADMKNEPLRSEGLN